jgi:hypothetical protein
VVGDDIVVDEHLAAVDDEVVAIGNRPALHGFGQQARVLLVERPGQHAVAGGHSRQQRGAQRLGTVGGDSMTGRDRVRALGVRLETHRRLP